MKLAIYSTKQYDKKYLQQVNEAFGFELEFFDFLLTEKPAKTAHGCEAVCIFVNDDGSRPVLEELKKDWSKRVTGLAILEAAPEQLHTEIDGVKIEANFDNFMDWLRQAALDEVYLDVAQESRTCCPISRRWRAWG